MNDFELKTISVPGEFKLKEKGSVFIAVSFPCESEKDFSDIYTSIKKKYYDATHHCYAYKLFAGKEKYSDDGEPNGTAGIRILNAITHFELTNLVVIIVRYFGGTKLGVGPLGKAYYEAAQELLSNTAVIKKTRYSFCRIKFEYDLTSMVHHQLKEFEAREIKNMFDVIPIVECAIKAERINSFANTLMESTRGKVSLEMLEDRFLL